MVRLTGSATPKVGGAGTKGSRRSGHGIHIIENLNLEALARDRRYAFAFFCAPVKWTGATGAPVRPVALCPT